MNTSYDSIFTPKTLDERRYFDTLVDFSTPMSTLSTRFGMNPTASKHCLDYSERTPSDRDHNLTVIEDCPHSNQEIIDQLLEKFNAHKNHFHSTQNHLHLLDGHLHEISGVLHQLQNSLDRHSSLKSTADHLETRVLQMTTKREQIRCAMDNLNPSPTIGQTLGDIVHQISPTVSKPAPTSYADLLAAVHASLCQRKTCIEHFHHDQHRRENSHAQVKRRQQSLMQLVEKIVEENQNNDKYIQAINADKPQFDHHTEHAEALNRLTEEYQQLQEENRLLKDRAKDNIKSLYTSISQTIE